MEKSWCSRHLITCSVWATDPWGCLGAQLLICICSEQTNQTSSTFFSKRTSLLPREKACHPPEAILAEGRFSQACFSNSGHLAEILWNLTGNINAWQKGSHCLQQNISAFCSLARVRRRGGEHYFLLPPPLSLLLSLASLHSSIQWSKDVPSAFIFHQTTRECFNFIL